MLLSSWRRTLIFLCMAGMEVAWITPFFLLMLPGAPPATVSWGMLLGALLAWIVALELLGRTEVPSPFYEMSAFGLLFVSALLLVRLLLYRSYPAGDFSWLGQAASDVVNSPGRFPPVVAIILTDVFLWHRATTATGREISFFNVGMSFRRGLLLLILGAGLYSTLRGQSLLTLLWIFLGCGLMAVALARIDEKTRGAQSIGTPLPPRRLGQLVVAVGSTVGFIVLLSRVVTQDALVSLLRLLNPVWRLIEPLLTMLILLLARLVEPLLRWVESLLASLLVGRETPVLTEPSLPALPEGQGALPDKLPYWLTDLLPRILLIVLGVLAAVAVVGFLLLWLERSRAHRSAAQAEEEGLESWALGAGLLGRAADSLRSAVGMVGRFGVSRQMLAAISVENIYANVCRLARRRGYGRRSSQSPDDYLPTLARAFAGHDEALARITAAYMHVHYGDHPVTAEQIAALREDYRALRESPQV